jgi:hypothetical protein
VTSLLISPIAWTGYTLLTLPILYERAQWKWPHWAAAFIFAVPFFYPLTLFLKSFFHFVFFGWFYGWGLLLILFELLMGKPTLRGESTASAQGLSPARHTN